MSEIRDRAAGLTVSSRARVARGATRTARSLWRIDSSQALLLRRRPPFSGGGDAVPDADAIRARLRTLIRGGGLPVINKVEPIWAGRCQEEKDCGICGVGIEIGQIEYEATWAD